MKKIYYWSPHISRVATIKNVINSATALSRYGDSSALVSIINVFGEWKGFKKKLDYYGVNLINLSNLDFSAYLPISGYLKGRLFYLLIFFFKTLSLKKVILKDKPDYLIIHLITSIPLILLAFNKFNTKFVLRISGLPKLNFFRRFLWKIISKRVYLVTCPSLETKNYIQKQNIFLKEKIVTLYDPILEINFIRKSLNDNNNSNLLKNNFFISAGRLTDQKNHKLLINAFSKFKNKNIYLYIAGEGEKKKYLSNLIKQNNLENKVFLLGQIDNIFPFFKKSLAVISTSLWEDPGAVMIEAAYCKKNIISSNCPNGPNEFLMNGKSGYLFKNNDQKDLEIKIDEFLNDNGDTKLKKIKYSLKNSKKYTLFRHYIQLKELINLN